MMNWVIMAFVLVGGVLLQAVLPSPAVLGQAKVPILVAVILYYALNRGIGTMLAAAFAAGLLHDALSPMPLGYSVLVFAAAGWVASRFRDLVMTDSIVTAAFFGAVAGAATTLMYYLLLLRDGLLACTVAWAGLKALGTGLLCMISTPVVFAVVGRLDRLVGNVEVTGVTDVLE